MPRFTENDIVGFDAQPFGRAVLRITGFDELEDGQRVYEVTVLKSSHDDFTEGEDATVTVGNQNLCAPQETPDVATGDD